MSKRFHFSSAIQTHRVSIALIFLFAFCGLIFLAISSSSSSSRKTFEKPLSASRIQAQQLPQTCPTCAPPKTQVIYAPLIDLPDAASSEIVLNCRSAHEMVLTPIFYTVEGQPIAGSNITLQPAEMRFVDTKSLIPARERNRRWGGTSLTYTGNLQEAWAQLTLKGLRGGGSANVFFAVVDQPRANSIESVWWMPRNAEAVIALGNSSDQLTHANLTFGNGESQNIDIQPFATEIVKSWPLRE